MAAHGRLKNEFTENEKYHNLMSWLNCDLEDEKQNVLCHWFMLWSGGLVAVELACKSVPFSHNPRFPKIHSGFE